MLSCMLGCVAGCASKPVVFHAYADGTFAWWDLKLYADQTFDMYLAAASYEGKYELDADTILLEYHEGPRQPAPPAFCIYPQEGIIRSMERDSLGHWVKGEVSHWMQVMEDHRTGDAAR
jgi:hypothetical protein